MSSTYPTTLQDLDATRGAAGDTLASPNHADHHALEDATTEALQTKVGIDGSADTSSIDYKLKSTSSINPGHKHTATSLTLALDDLSDVTITTPADGNGLIYDAGSGTWKNATTSTADASTTVKGVTKLSVAPVSSTVSIAVGDNDGRVPTQNENDALVGTSGTSVSSSNKLVDAGDVSSSAASGKIVRANGTALPALSGASVTGVIHNAGELVTYAAGTYFLVASDAATQIITASPTKTKEILMPQGGVVTVLFDLASFNNSSTVHGRIYLNGTATGTDRTTTSSTYTTYTENITISSGDLLQIYLTGTGSARADCQNFRIYASTALSPVIGPDISN